MRSDQQYISNQCGRLRGLLVMALASLSALGGFSTAHGECARQWNALIPPSEYRGFPFTVFEFDDGSGPVHYFGGVIYKVSEPSLGTVILRYDGSSWSQVGGEFRYSSNGGVVYRLGQFRGELIAAGYFNSVAGQSINSIACLRNGTWQPLGDGVTNGYGYPTVRSVCEYQGKLIAGGNFFTAGDQPANHIAAWDGASWASLGSGVSFTSDTQFVYDMLEYENKLLVGGDFLSAGGIGATRRIALWNGHEWTNAMSLGASGSVRTFHEHQGQLLAGGFFSAWQTGVLYWNGTQWTAFGGLNNYTIKSLVTLNGDLFAAGNYISCPGQPFNTNMVSRRDGATWIPLGTGITIFGCFTGIADAIRYQHSLLIVGDLAAGQPYPGSGMATLDPIDPVPLIIEQPGAQSLILGHTFNAAVVAQETMTYQWRRDGIAITDDGRIIGATTANLTITDVDFPDGGQYDVLAINDCGQVASEPVTLTIACGGARPSGDLNFDGTTDGLDIPLFMDAVLAGSRAGAVVCRADFTYDHIMTDADIGPFVAKLLD